MRLLIAHVACVLTATGGLATQAQAETIAKKTVKGLSQFVPLTKLTVGPDDQYNADLDGTAKTLVFTHKADLVSHLEIQNLASGDSRPLLPDDADSQEASFGPDGQSLVFTYFKFNARGDICYTSSTIGVPNIRCLKRGVAQSRSQRSNPFWRSALEIGFLERDISTQETRVVSESTKNGVQEILAQGRIWAPAMSSTGRYLAFIEWQDGTAPPTLSTPTSAREASSPTSSRRNLVVLDLTTHQRKVIRFALPGISGFPQFDEDGSHLYFSHFLNDTNGDQTIDGSDNAVIFRVALKDILNADGEIFPEQLTSVETSCSFPRPSHGRLLATCAYEGSLDIYQLPLTGIVPAEWDEPRLLNALTASRSYEDRILLLNTRKYRNAKLKGEIDEQLLGDHLLAGDTRAARFYLEHRLFNAHEPARGSEAVFLQALNIELKAREFKSVQPPGQISREFRNFVDAAEKELGRIHASREMSAIVGGHLRLMLDDRNGAEVGLKTATGELSHSKNARPIELHLFFNLAEELAALKGPKAFPDLIAPYRRMISAPELGEQVKIFYTFELLKHAHAFYRTRAERGRLIQSLLQSQRGSRPEEKLSKPVEELLSSEARELELIESPSDAGKEKAYAKLDELISITRDDSFARRALYVRAIVNFTEAAEFRYLAAIVTNWLRYTKNDDTEFAYAREVYADSELTQGYAHLARGELKLAGNYFSESLALTDDLESHFAYIQAKLQEGLRKQVDVDYAVLKKRGFIDENMKFVEAVLTLNDEAASAGKNEKDVAALDQAIARLESMTEGRDSAVRHLLLGWCRMEKLLRLADGYDFDEMLFKGAHHDLVLAYDLGRDNARIKASALIDLGILHQRVQNHGQAARYFELRKKLDFRSDAARKDLNFLYARSLNFVRRPEVAAKELSVAVVSDRNRSEPLAPFTERRAFSLASSAHFKEANSLYQSLLSQAKIEGAENQARVNLMYGYSLLNAGDSAQASQVLTKAIMLARGLKSRKRMADELIDFDPRRIVLAALGFLGQIGTSDQRIRALEERATLLDGAKALIDEPLAEQVRVSLQIASVQTERGDQAAAALALNRAVKTALDYGGGASGQYLGQVTFRAAASLMEHAATHAQSHMQSQLGDESRAIESLVKKCRSAYESQKVSTATLDAQNLQLQILWADYSRRILHRSAPEPKEILASELAKRLREERPELERPIAELSRGLQL